MNPKILDYLYLAATIFFTVYGQLVLKWRLGTLTGIPAEFLPKVKFLVLMLFDPWVFSGFFAAFLASIAWMAAISKMDLSHAYPFMSLNFVIVVVLSGWLLHEPITVPKILGVALIVAGTVIVARA